MRHKQTRTEFVEHDIQAVRPVKRENNIMSLKGFLRILQWLGGEGPTYKSLDNDDSPVELADKSFDDTVPDTPPAIESYEEDSCTNKHVPTSSIRPSRVKAQPSRYPDPS